MFQLNKKKGVRKMNYYLVFGFVLRTQLNIDFLNNIKIGDINNHPIIIDIIYKDSETFEYENITFLGMLYGGYMRCYDSTNFILLFYDDILLKIYKTGKRIELVCKIDSISEGLRCLVSAPLIICNYYLGRTIYHAASFSFDNKTYAILGNSGIGKSTLISSLISQAGVTFNADDILSISTTETDMIAYPSCSLPMKLWDKSLPYFQTICSDFQKKKINPDIEKYWIYIKNCNMSELPISTIFVLKPYFPNEKDTAIEFREMQFIDKFETLTKNLHVLWCLDNNLRNLQISKISSVTKKIKLIELHYPRSFEKLNDVIKAIMKYIRTDTNNN